MVARETSGPSCGDLDAGRAALPSRPGHDLSLAETSVIVEAAGQETGPYDFALDVCENRSKDGPGLVQVYTGEGKGKTTAALGLALRAVGQGMNVVVIQFLKGNDACGEHLFCSRFHPFELLQPNSQSHWRQSRETLQSMAGEAQRLAREAMLSGRYQLVILDEVNVAVTNGLLPVQHALDLIDEKPPGVELVLTGRGAPPEVVRRADLVTEMRAVKHPFHRGVTARKGIEF